MKKTSDLFLYDLKTGQISPMPTGLGVSFLENKFFRGILMNQYASKFTGFLADTKWVTSLALKSDKIPRNLTKTLQNNPELKTLNKAFTYRNPRQIFPPESAQISRDFREKIMISPVDSYLNIREIKDGKIELYPELVLDLAKMIGAENSAKFSDGGQFFLFTLKPHHDHTVDYPLRSRVLSKPREFSREKWRVYSTDLNFTKKIAESGATVFDENHRVVTELLATDYDEPYFMVEVGATNVNSIEQDNCSVGKIYAKGTQKSHFNFGSTVILLLPKNFADKVQVLDIFSRDFDTSVEVQRRNMIVIPHNIGGLDFKIEIADGVKGSILNK